MKVFSVGSQIEEVLNGSWVIVSHCVPSRADRLTSPLVLSSELLVERIYYKQDFISWKQRWDSHTFGFIYFPRGPTYDKNRTSRLFKEFFKKNVLKIFMGFLLNSRRRTVKLKG